MDYTTKIGIIVCERYRRCAAGKCLKALYNKEGAFGIYSDSKLQLVGLSTCDGCPGGNIEYVGEEMVKNGATAIHLATGMLIGYPPCPYLDTFKAVLEKSTHLRVVFGTHPMPQRYIDMHEYLGTFNDENWLEKVSPLMQNEGARAEYA